MIFTIRVGFHDAFKSNIKIAISVANQLWQYWHNILGNIAVRSEVHIDVNKFRMAGCFQFQSFSVLLISKMMKAFLLIAALIYCFGVLANAQLDNDKQLWSSYSKLFPNELERLVEAPTTLFQMQIQSRGANEALILGCAEYGNGDDLGYARKQLCLFILFF